MFGLLVLRYIYGRSYYILILNTTGLKSVSLVATINPEPWHILRNPFDFNTTLFVKSVLPPCALSVRLSGTAQRVPFIVVSGSSLLVIFHVSPLPRRAPSRYLSHIICVVVTTLILSTERNNFRRPRLHL